METLHSSIDIGSNTVRLWIAENRDGKWITLRKQTRVTRLSGGFDGRLQPEAVTRTLEALADYSAEINKLGVTNIRAACTGVTRRASNTPEFLDGVEKVARFRPVVISGETEAALSAMGAVLLTGLNKTPFLLFDIGGFSTEIIRITDGRPAFLASLEIGAVSLTEKFLDDVPSDAQIENLVERVGNALKEEFDSPSRAGFVPQVLVGTAGTPTTAAAIVQGMAAYEPEKVEGYCLTRLELEKLLDQARRIPSEKRIEVFPSLQRGREDVLVAGIIICLVISERCGIDTIRVTEGGLLEGLLLAERFPVV